MRHLSSRRLVSLALSLAILVIPTIVLVLTAAPSCARSGCM
jgi:hypothetical protein